MAKNLDVVTIGSIIKETIVYPDKQIGPVIGSPAAYSSLVMAAQGCKVGIVTYYGYDMENMISELDALDRTGFIPFAYTTTNNLVYRQDGTKYVEYTRKTPDIRFEDISDQYLEADFFKICPMNYEVELDLIEQLDAMGKTVFVDLGGYGGATSEIRHSVETEYGKMVVNTICKNCSIVKASEEDLASIIPGKTAEQAAQYLRDAGARTVVVTLGGKGVLYKIGDGAIRYRKPYQAVSEAPDGSLNFTGAGDSFGAGVMASYCHSRDVDKAVINGNATASIVIQRPGGCYFKRMPDKQSVEERISSLH